MVFKDTVLNVLSTPKKRRVVKFMLSGSPKMSEREMASVLKISHMSVNRILTELYGMNFLIKSRAGNVNIWEVNKQSYAYEIIETLYKDYPDAVEPLNRLKNMILKSLPKKGLKKVVLFGSVAQGLEEPGSDIDLLVIAETEKDKYILEEKLKKLGEECLTLFGNTLSPYLMTQKEYETKKNIAVVRNAEQGIKIIEGGNINDSKGKDKSG